MKTIQPLSEQSTAKRRKRVSPPGRLPLVVGFIMAFLAIASLVHWLLQYNLAQKIDRSGYQVVYLTNGQAYFGKLQNTTGDYLVMKDPYSAQSLAPKDADTAASTAQTTLLKVSQQVYGPQDSIAIKSDQVSFWQNLRSDSKVTAALKQK